MRIDPRNPWNHMKTKSRSDDKYDRLAALASAGGAVEVALAAFNMKKKPRESLPELIARSGLVTGRDTPDGVAITAANRARNAAVHEHDVPDKPWCQAHVQVFFQVWATLRRRFVTKGNAATLSRELLASGVFEQVFLFGSLARSQSEPKDIDFLLLDTGDISSRVTDYGLFGTSVAELVLEEASLLTDTNRKAVECGWLDFVVINGKRFGSDLAYTRSVARKHRDRLFFVNIASDLLSYDEGRNRWIDGQPQSFRRLALLRTQLENEGIV